MADGYIQPPPDAGGKKVDTTEITRPDGTLVERQRVLIGDDVVTLTTVCGLLKEVKQEINDLKMALLDALG